MPEANPYTQSESAPAAEIAELNDSIVLQQGSSRDQRRRQAGSGVRTLAEQARAGTEM